jgi:hypothetical protein
MLFTYGGVVQLQDLERKEVEGIVNGIRMKLYMDNLPTNSQ